jgi:hypothetical protein
MSWVEGERQQSRTDVLRASPPMFESRLLDALSRVHPAVPVLIFGPAIVVLTIWALSTLSLLGTIGLVAAGYAIWTLFEYWLHRLVFHFEPVEGLGARMHWIIHGVHHDHPNDPLRLVMPPAVSIPLGAVVFGALYLIFGAVRHDALLPASLPSPRAARPHAARTPHAPPLPGRHARLRHQRALLGRGLPHLPARAANVAISGFVTAVAPGNASRLGCWNTC